MGSGLAVGVRRVVGGRSVGLTLTPGQISLKKVGVIDERSFKKSKKHHARASGEAASIAKNHQVQPIWRSAAAPELSAAIRGNPRKRSWTASRDPPNTRAGGQDDVSS